jgi:cellulose synthase/poly-beta-1,6-N-acetylglucosamine synthase-like glycosyltransferase
MQFIPTFEFSIITIVFWTFCGILFINLLYTIFIYGKFAFFKQKNATNFAEGISVIIAARNEADNLFENLPYILEQQYPLFEVIIINHQSTDESAYILNAFSQQYKNLKIIEVEKSKHLRPGKKLPITLGVKAAKYEYLIFTDADCRPKGFDWLQKMANGFNNNKEIVLGFGPYYKSKGFLNQVIRFDTTWIAINYFSMALNRLPYMGVGRNMGYTKKIFNSVHGFKDHYAVSSGDDDLFIQQAAKNKNYAIVIEESSFTYSSPHQHWDRWLLQKSRHYTTTPFYGVIKKTMLGIYPLTSILAWLTFVILMFNNDFRWISLGVFMFVTIIKWIILAKCFSNLKEKSFHYLLPFYDLIYTFLMPFVYYSSDKKKTNKW